MNISASEFIPMGNAFTRPDYRDLVNFTEEQTARCDLGECRTNLLPMIREMSQIVTESGNPEVILHTLLQIMRIEKFFSYIKQGRISDCKLHLFCFPRAGGTKNYSASGIFNGLLNLGYHCKLLTNILN